jgi:hypothetical protein
VRPLDVVLLQIDSYTTKPSSAPRSSMLSSSSQLWRNETLVATCHHREGPFILQRRAIRRLGQFQRLSRQRNSSPLAHGIGSRKKLFYVPISSVTLEQQLRRVGWGGDFFWWLTTYRVGNFLSSRRQWWGGVGHPWPGCGSWPVRPGLGQIFRCSRPRAVYQHTGTNLPT